MDQQRRTALLQALPSVEELLQDASLAADLKPLGPRLARDVVRTVLQRRRDCILALNAENASSSVDGNGSDLAGQIRTAARQELRFSLRPVLNATGVILHTNLGRAPLAAEAAQRLMELAQSYSNLELDLESGRRGKRDVHVETLACRLTGAERTVVVNNNAAAVLLLLNTLCVGERNEVLVSRGELVEIGGSFRVPDIMTRSGARLVEVGTTNRTRIADYRAALSPRSALILRVHRSNFQMSGFVEQPPLSELVKLAGEARVPLAEDLGSGCLVDLRQAGLRREPLVAESVAAGVDAVTYSGDKLLGGPQAGLISGRKTLVDQLRSNPMFRALRVDRLTYAALEVTLRMYLEERAQAELPALRMIFAGDGRDRAAAFITRLDAWWNPGLVQGYSVIGGGSTPGEQIPSVLVQLCPQGVSASSLHEKLRAADPPVLARIEEDKLLLDLRTILPSQEELLIRTLGTLRSLLSS